MAVQCPYCRHEVSLKTAPPGMYTTACRECGRKFYLAVPEDSAQPPVAAPIPAERDQPARNPKAQASVAAPLAGAGKAKTNDADAPLLTLPERARSSSTVSGANEPPQATGPQAETSLPDASPTTWASPKGYAIPRLVGGYFLLRELGRGALGPVSLARPVWLNRVVTLKVMKPLWARNATFVARFTRQAYAAGLLVHHNLAQIYDFGDEKGTTYVCTEAIDGPNLADLTVQKKQLEPEEAVACILQAARGLRYAHDQTLIHRDIKPENLLVDRLGLVKLADLGLVNSPELAEALEAISAGKTAPPSQAGGDPASASSPTNTVEPVVGTPSYMAPEQARDAARVDVRADIYSLGCTLYFLVTGRPPFEGRSVSEIVTKHQSEPVTPPDHVVKRVPRSLSAILLKMLAKKPDERYASAGEVIDALEDFMGVASSGSFAPREEQASLLEQCVQQFNASPSARLRSRLVPSILGACFALALLCLLTGRPIGASVFATLGFLTALADFVLVGIWRKTPLFFKVCELIAGARLSEWLTALTALAILAALLMILKLFWIWLGLGFLAIGIAVAIHAAFDRQVAAERRECLAQAEGMLRSLRMQGWDEDALRQFFCVYSGTDWEEFYEALFGYEAKLDARQRWGRGDRTGSRPRFAPWRDVAASWLDARIGARRAADETAKLEKIEEKSLQSEGENLVSARRKARRRALALVATAAEIKESIRSRDGTFTVNRSIASAMRDAALKPEKVLLAHERGLLPDEERSSVVPRVVNLVLGPNVRFLVGAALLAGCIAWMHQNAMISAEQAGALVEAAKAGDVQAIQSHAEAGIARAREVAARPTEILDLPFVPPRILALVSSFGAGAGGLFLIVSALIPGVRIAYFAIPASAIPVLLPSFWHPALGGLKLDPSLVPSLAGAAILGAGLLLGRR
jgi:eukaryotic-like serine/threonine-protein kinase